MPDQLLYDLKTDRHVFNCRLHNRTNNINGRCNDGLPFLFHVIDQHDNISLIRRLFDYELNVNVISKDGISPIIYCLKHTVPNVLNVLKILLDAGARTSDICYNDRSVLYYAVLLNNIQVIELLFCYDVAKYISHENNDKETPLMLAIGKKNYEIVKLLLNNGAKENINHQNKNGDTALILAAKNDCYNIATLLLDNGADQTIENNKGYTALLVSPNPKMTKLFSSLSNDDMYLKLMIKYENLDHKLDNLIEKIDRLCLHLMT